MIDSIEILSTVMLPIISTVHTKLPVSFTESTNTMKTEQPDKGDPKGPITLNGKSHWAPMESRCPELEGTPRPNFPLHSGPGSLPGWTVSGLFHL